MTSASSFLNTSSSALQTSYLVADHAPLSATSVVTVSADTNTQTRDLLNLNSRLDDILARTRSQSSLGVRVSPPKVSTTTETYLRSSPGASGLRYSGIETNLRKSNAELKAILRTDSPTLRKSLIDGTKTKTVTFASPSSLSKSYSTSYINTNSYTLPASYTEKPTYTYLNTSYTAAPATTTVKTSSPSRADYKYTLYEPITYTATRVSDPLAYTSTKVESPSYKTSTYTATRIESPSYTKVVEPASYVATKVVEPPSYYTTTVREPTYTTATVLEPYTYTTTRVVEPSTYTTTKIDSPKKSTSLTDLSYSYRPATTVSYESVKKASSPTFSPKRYVETTKASSSPSKLLYDKDRLDQLISRIQTTRATYSPVRTSTYSPSKTTSYLATSTYAPATTTQYHYTTSAAPVSANTSYLYTSATSPYYTSTSAAAPYVSTSTIRSAPYVDTERVKSTGVNRQTEYHSQSHAQSHLGKLENDVESLTFDDATGEPVRNRKAH